MRTVTILSVFVILGVLAACSGPAVPTATPLPEPMPTPVWVLASKPEDLEGIWFLEAFKRDHYFWWDAEGTIWKTVDTKDNTPDAWGRFWFEEGMYYEERDGIPGIGVYEPHITMQGGRAIRLRMEVIEDTRDFGGLFPRYGGVPFARVD